MLLLLLMLLLLPLGMVIDHVISRGIERIDPAAVGSSSAVAVDGRPRRMICWRMSLLWNILHRWSIGRYMTLLLHLHRWRIGWDMILRFDAVQCGDDGGCIRG